jgi:MFS superfamily sulfate permease-like transporter
MLNKIVNVLSSIRSKNKKPMTFWEAFKDAFFNVWEIQMVHITFIAFGIGILYGFITLVFKIPLWAYFITPVVIVLIMYIIELTPVIKDRMRKTTKKQ